MQDKKMTIAKKVLLALADYWGVKGIKGVVTYLNEDKNKIYAWSKRGTIADTGVILAKSPEIRKEWLETGEGEMLNNAANVFYEMAKPNGNLANDKPVEYSHDIDYILQLCKEHPLVRLMVPGAAGLSKERQKELLRIISEFTDDDDEN
jgi:hypothetical protein